MDRGLGSARLGLCAIVLLLSCKKDPPKPTLDAGVPRASVSVPATPTALAPDAAASVLPSVPPAPPPVNAFEPNACDQPFPKVGMRWVDAMRTKLQLIGDVGGGNFQPRDEDETDKVAYEILEAEGDRPTAVRVAIEVRGRPEAHDVRLRNGEPVSLRRTTPHDAFVLSGIENAIVRGQPFAKGARVPALEKPIGDHLGHFGEEGIEVQAHFTAKRKTAHGEVLIFAIKAKTTRVQISGCNARYDSLDGKGQLVARAADGAIVELTLAGPFAYKESVCKADGVTQGKRLPIGHGRGELKLTRDCFKTAIADPDAPSPKRDDEP